MGHLISILLRDVPKVMWLNRNFVIQKLSGANYISANAYSYICDELKADPEIVLKVVTKDISMLGRLNARWRTDMNFMKAILKTNLYAIC